MGMVLLLVVAAFFVPIILVRQTYREIEKDKAEEEKAIRERKKGVLQSKQETARSYDSYGEECRRKEAARQARLEELKKQQELSEKRLKDYIVFDLETTGLSPQWNEIIEIGAVKVVSGEVEEVFSELIRPDKPVTQKITEITGITNEMLEGKPSINKVLPEFLEFSRGYVLVGHNVTFDSGFLSVSAQKLKLGYSSKLVDTLSMSRRAFPLMNHHKLSDMCGVFGITNDSAHRALSDCYATRQVFECLQNEVPAIVFRSKRIELVPRTPKFTPKTEAISELIYLLGDVSADGVIEENEVLSLQIWLAQNEEFCNEYPLNRVSEVIRKALEDDVLEQSELDEMLKIFLEMIQPKYESKLTLENTEAAVCLDGEFKHASKREVTEELEKHGFEIKRQMSGKVKYLIVGDLGSYEWGYDGFGQKILKAMELQSKGKDVKIVKEKVFFHALKRYAELSTVK